MRYNIAALLAAFLVSSAQAVEFNQFQAEKSAVSFVFRQMNVPVDGQFKRVKGQMSFDPARPALARAEIELDLAAIDLGSAEANDEAAGKLWFNTKQFPTARFVAAGLKPAGSGRFEAVGKLTIKGRTSDLPVPLIVRDEGKQAVFEGTVTIKRADFGVGEGIWADFGTVANEVQIKFRLLASAAGK